MAPKGQTVRQQLEAWRLGQPPTTRNEALRLAGLQNLYEIILADGELSIKTQLSLRSSRIQRKLAAIGIDMERTWVDMAKTVVDPTRDWFPEVTTRRLVVDLLRPYVTKAGGTSQLSRMFFGEKEIESLFWEAPQGHLPGFEMLVAIVRLCVEDSRNGGDGTGWTSNHLQLMEAQWSIFGRGHVPFPKLTGEEEFNDWFCQRVPHERVDHIAKALNQALEKETFTSALLISWRKGHIPSPAKLQEFFRAINMAFPEWVPQSSHDADTAIQDLPPPKVAKPDKPLSPSPPAIMHARTQLAEAPSISSITQVLQRIVSALEAELPELALAEKTLIARLNGAPIQDVHQALPARTSAQDPGEVVKGLRFVLTQASFRRVDVFTLDEVDDTALLISELARRLALVNSMNPQDKRAVLRRLKTTFDELFVQMRHMDTAQTEDLPAMFADMRITSAILAGENPEEIE
jgi:hypothetical protein